MLHHVLWDSFRMNSNILFYFFFYSSFSFSYIHSFACSLIKEREIRISSRSVTTDKKFVLKATNLFHPPSLFQHIHIRQSWPSYRPTAAFSQRRLLFSFSCALTRIHTSLSTVRLFIYPVIVKHSCIKCFREERRSNFPLFSFFRDRRLVFFF